MRYKQDHQKYAQMSAICKPKLKFNDIWLDQMPVIIIYLPPIFLLMPPRSRCSFLVLPLLINLQCNKPLLITLPTPPTKEYIHYTEETPVINQPTSIISVTMMLMITIRPVDIFSNMPQWVWYQHFFLPLYWNLMMLMSAVSIASLENTCQSATHNNFNVQIVLSFLPTIPWFMGDEHISSWKANAGMPITMTSAAHMSRLQIHNFWWMTETIQ